ncbi:polycystic kidney disease 2 [Elysia marginata]|uniref:Polycystic kidney disease 2 n=1 Tax=Elysia marginata TaxID=1093978 RepID=A0AAV4EDE8_9GAST|nr:polycystic kidney disease 2 [Elysia marginata]
MVEFGWALRHVTFFIHNQAAPESASLFCLQNKIYKALKKAVRLPNVVFHTGVYWLMIYASITLLMVNLQTDVFLTNAQRTHIYHKFGLHREERAITVDQMWEFLENRLRPGLIYMEANVNVSFESGDEYSATNSTMGGFLISPVRLKQIRCQPFDGSDCSPLPYADIDNERQCNFEFTRDKMETGSFGNSWAHRVHGASKSDHYTYTQDNASIFGGFDLLPRSGFHFVYSLSGNKFYYMAVVKVFFVLISSYNIITELLLIYRTGVLNYLRTVSNYIEITKVSLSILLGVIFVQMSILKSNLLKELKEAYQLREESEAIDFLAVAVMDYIYTVAGGVLAFLCIFQILNMLSKIRRLVIFMRLVFEAVKLFSMPVVGGMAFTFLSRIIFGSTNRFFADYGSSYLMINQYFVKPRAIYHDLQDNHPYLGPLFVFTLGVNINIFLLNFFIAILNEAYSSIKNQVRIESYKIRDKTTMEYVYEFLGIKNKIIFDVTDDMLLVEREREKDLVAEIKHLRSY